MESSTRQPSRYLVPMGREHGGLHRVGQHISLTGERLQLTTIYMPPEAQVDWHSHPQESFVLVIAGAYHIWVGEEEFELKPGWACWIPADTPHRAIVGPEPTVEIEIFAPPREDWAAIARNSIVDQRGVGMKLSWLTLGKHHKKDMVQMAQESEKAGFEAFWYADERFYMETYSSLTYCSVHTERIQLGPGVTDPYSRHPALTAMALATLDHLSDGRAVLGLGAGNSGFRELFIKRVHPASAVRETVQVIRGLLAGESVTIDGKVIKLQNCKLAYPPERQVPIIVASNGQLIIRVAGEVGDGVMSSSVLVEPRVSEVLELVDQGLQKSGRKRADFDVWSRLNIAIHTDARRAYQAAKPMIYNLICGKYPDTGMFDRLGLPLSNDLRHTVETVGNTHDPEKLSWIVEQMSDEYVQKTCLAGTPQLIIEQLKTLEQSGFDGAILYPIPVEDQSYLDVLETVSSEIIPRCLEREP